MPPAEAIEDRETIGAQAGEQLQHRLIDHLRVEPARPRMSRRRDPIGSDLLEFLSGHAGMRGHHQLDDRRFAAGQRDIQIALERRGERLGLTPLGMLRRQRPEAVEGEKCLDGHGLLNPERAVVIKDSDPLQRRDEVRVALLRHSGNKLDERLLGRTVVPGNQPIRNGRVCVILLHS